MSDTKLDLVAHINQAALLHLFFTLVDFSKSLDRDCVMSRKLDLGDQVTVHLTEVCIIELGDVLNLLILTTGDASWVLSSDADIPELHREAFENDHPFSQNILFSKAKNDLDNFHGLDLPDQAWYHAEDPAVRTVGHCLRGRW